MKSRNSCGHLAQAMVMVWLLHAFTLLLSSTNGEEYDYDEPQNYSDVDADNSDELMTGYSHGGPETFHTTFRSHCQACQYRNVYAMASLKSIKAHVLMKLGYDFTPNMTRYPEVPPHIVKSFMKQQQQQQQQQSSSAESEKDYMADDPSAGVEEIEEDFDYYPITNKIYILAKRKSKCGRKHSNHLAF